MKKFVFGSMEILEQVNKESYNVDNVDNGKGLSDSGSIASMKKYDGFADNKINDKDFFTGKCIDGDMAKIGDNVLIIKKMISGKMSTIIKLIDNVNPKNVYKIQMTQGEEGVKVTKFISKDPSTIINSKISNGDILYTIKPTGASDKETQMHVIESEAASLLLRLLPLPEPLNGK